jgi:hypothetical protein
MTQEATERKQRQLDLYYKYFRTFLSNNALNKLSLLVELEILLTAEDGR